MTLYMTRLSLVLSFSFLLGVLSGCGSDRKKVKAPIVAQEVFDGTIGTACELTGYAPIRIQGFSLVWGLSETGSSECPPSIRKHLIDVLRKADIQKVMSPFYARLSADKIIEHSSTSVVWVRGWIPAGATKNASFDVQVSALPSTQTTSLKGGILFPIDLQVVSAGTGARLLAGLPVAIAAGRVFVNPFTLSDSNSLGRQTDPRRGSVIGGGRSLKDRNIQMVLFNPSTRLAQKIQNRINGRFATIDDVKVANGMNRQIIQLVIPDEYDDRPTHFISLVLSLYLDDRPGFQDAKLAELRELANQSDADYEAIAMVWESIGRTAMDQLEEFYSQQYDCRAYYAARTALNLGELNAIDLIAKIAVDANHPCQVLAANELVRYHKDPKARQTLAKLLDSDRQELRFAAYRGLRDIGDRRVRTAKFPGDFIVDQVRSSGPQELVVWLDEHPRLVLFGQNVRCPEDFFFETSDQGIVISAKPGSDELTIMRKVGQKKTHLASFTSSYDLLELIHVMAKPMRRPDSKKPRGVGLSFSEIVGVLSEMCGEESQALPIKFKIYREVQNPSA